MVNTSNVVVQEVNLNTYMITGSLYEILAHGQVPLLKMLYVHHHTAHISTWIKMKRADLRGGGKLNGLGNPIVQMCSLLTKALWKVEAEYDFLASPLCPAHTLISFA